MSTSTSFYLVPTPKGLTLQAEKPCVQRKNKRILVLGGSVTGLTTAWALLDYGYDVTVVSEKWAPSEPRITGQIAGALWEYPPAVCGKHTDEISLAHSKGWSMVSYRVFSDIIKAEPDASSHGIRMRMANFFMDKKIEDSPEEYKKMKEIEQLDFQGFLRDPSIITRLAVNQNAGVVDSYQHLAPVIDTDAYLVWLKNLVGEKGAKFETAKITGDLLLHEDELLAKHDAAVLVNATGLASLELAADPTVYPLRGALIRLVNDGKKFPKVTQAFAVTHDEERGQDDIVFIVPRNDNVLILGGIAQADKWDLDLTLDSPEMKLIRSRCNNFVPGMENGDLDPEVSIMQGLRPFRKANIRVERELRKKKDGNSSKIVHSYGHGGAGYSVSFGCAGDVVALVREVETGATPKKMTVDAAGNSLTL